MSTELNNIQAHLNSDQKNFIDILNVETDNYIKRKLYINEITEKYGSLENYLTKLVTDGFKKLQIFRRQKRGSSSALLGSVINIGIETKEPSKNESPLNYPQAEHLSQPQYQQPSESSGYYREKIADLREKITDLKEEISDHKADKRTLKSKIDTYENEIRDYKVKVATFDKESELSLKLQALENKSFWDSDTSKTLIEEGLSIAANFSEKSTPSQLNASNSNTFSEVKKALLMFVEQDQITDVQCQKVYYTLVGLVQKKEDFITELEELLDKHNLKSQN